MTEDQPIVRAVFATARVQCLNKDCADYRRARIIEAPHLGDSVFLGLTTTGAFSLPMLNLICGTCNGTFFGMADA